MAIDILHKGSTERWMLGKNHITAIVQHAVDSLSHILGSLNLYTTKKLFVMIYRLYTTLLFTGEHSDRR